LVKHRSNRGACLHRNVGEQLGRVVLELSDLVSHIDRAGSFDQ
jgi:hypothetical protein